VRDFAWDQLVPSHDAEIERVTIPLNGHDHLFLVSPPNPETGVNPEEAATTLIGGGLSEFVDVGSLPRLHQAVAAVKPDHWIISQSAKGISHSGQTLPFAEAGARWVEEIAAENLELMRRLTNGGPLELVGVSLHSFIHAYMAAINLTANPHQQLDIPVIRPVSSALIATDVYPHEDFREADIDEDAFRAQLSGGFKAHVVKEALTMLINHPRDMLACSPNLLAYLLYPEKAPSRFRAIEADYQSVKQGFPWSILRMLGGALQIDVTLGDRDNLTPPQIPQWQRLKELSPEGNVNLALVKDAGHLMTVRHKAIAKALSRPALSEAA
ncbi:MAG TPA: hypothetical protein VII55_03330, partial [Candidatus Saccharimonadales bacterium]